MAFARIADRVQLRQALPRRRFLGDLGLSCCLRNRWRQRRRRNGLVWSGFNFDILEFVTEFEPEAVAISTRQHVHPAELGFEGRFRGQHVYLHLYLEPPEDAEATEILDLRGDGEPVLRDKE